MIVPRDTVIGREKVNFHGKKKRIEKEKNHWKKIQSTSRVILADLQVTTHIMASIGQVNAAKSQGAPSAELQDSAVSVTNEDDRDLLKLGYRSVLARSWGSFDNFACSFSALNVIGGIRVLFYIALSGGGPAAM